MNELIKINRITVNDFSIEVGKTYNVFQKGLVLYENLYITGIEVKGFTNRDKEYYKVDFLIYSNQRIIFASALINNNLIFQEV